MLPLDKLFRCDRCNSSENKHLMKDCKYCRFQFCHTSCMGPNDLSLDEWLCDWCVYSISKKLRDRLIKDKGYQLKQA